MFKSTEQTYDILYIILWFSLFIHTIFIKLTLRDSKKETNYVKIYKIDLNLLFLILYVISNIYVWLNIEYHKFQEHCHMIENYHIH
jgi:hypothetical protein